MKLEKSPADAGKGPLKLERKTLNDVPGIPCPQCGEGRLRFASLEAFLQAVPFGLAPRCDRCGEAPRMDVSGAMPVVEKLRDVDQKEKLAERLLADAGG